MTDIKEMLLKKSIFLILLLICFSSFVSTPIALILGLMYALFFKNPFASQSQKASKYLLQFSIVGLGFGMNLYESLQTGKTGILLTITTVFGVLVLGVLIGKLLQLNRIIAYLISVGTAICGGSAIGAVSPIIKASDDEISISIGTVFSLNAIALFLFPPIGHFFNLSQAEFGLWSAIAIHDTSSVVGAAASYGEEALKIATTVKLTRALWIIPIALITSFIFSQKAEKMYKPWFILFFILAMLINTFISLPESLTHHIVAIAKQGFTITLFLIGTDLSVEAIKKTGIKAFLLAVILWLIISASSLIAIKFI